MQILYEDDELIVCIKPASVLSTDEPGGVPSLLREQLGLEEIRTVHRLDRVVSGVMVLCKSAQGASELSRQIREGGFDKRYLAVVHGRTEAHGAFTDLLRRDKRECKTYVAEKPDKGVQEARLLYDTLGRSEELSLVAIQLLTGRTHQIRCQFSAHGFPLVGDRKYGLPEDGGEIALWSYSLRFSHPKTGKELRFSALPPEQDPWTGLIGAVQDSEFLKN